MKPKPKPRSVWVWKEGRRNIDWNCPIKRTRPLLLQLFGYNGFQSGYVEFREVLPKKRKAKVRRGK